MSLLINYHPYKSGFPYKLLKYLFDNGISNGTEIQEKIGLNEWYCQKGTIYTNRAFSVFDNIISQLHSKELINILPDDYYELTEKGKVFMNIYISQRHR